ncbi:hypothetical protein [Natroniella sp. ANB-PHB2]|uniref:hypothetical protein n=1 Tax=Natroniella sp. ANB-PHB2 TaxID=3384444 RepID=UPI0038D39D47
MDDKVTYFIVDPSKRDFEKALFWVVEGDIEKAKRMAIQDGLDIYQMDKEGIIKNITFEVMNNDE